MPRRPVAIGSPQYTERILDGRGEKLERDCRFPPFQIDPKWKAAPWSGMPISCGKWLCLGSCRQEKFPVSGGSIKDASTVALPMNLNLEKLTREMYLRMLSAFTFLKWLECNQWSGRSLHWCRNAPAQSESLWKLNKGYAGVVLPFE